MKIQSLSLKDLWASRESWFPIAFFVAGFLFDIISLGRIDSALGLAQQAFYLIVCGAGIGLEILQGAGKFRPAGRQQTLWRYYEPALHFLLGSLLSAYTLFYFKAASIFGSFVFLILMIAVLLVNEFKKFGAGGTQARLGLFTLCVISYFVYVVPILLGFIGTLPFLLALVVSAVSMTPLYFVLKKKLGAGAEALRKSFLIPALSTLGLFAALYFLRLIPPVPLSVIYMGIYHDIKKENGKYLLTSTRPFWKFWQNGDQTFEARAGDKIYFFTRVFSPTRFNDQLKVRWLYKDERSGWSQSDAIALPIAGGREEGYRGVTFKTNYQPGKWQVQLETLDNRELGRIYFTVFPDEGTGPREMKQEIQ